MMRMLFTMMMMMVKKSITDDLPLRDGMGVDVVSGSMNHGSTGGRVGRVALSQPYHVGRRILATWDRTLADPSVPLRIN